MLIRAFAVFGGGALLVAAALFLAPVSLTATYVCGILGTAVCFGSFGWLAWKASG